MFVDNLNAVPLWINSYRHDNLFIFVSDKDLTLHINTDHYKWLFPWNTWSRLFFFSSSKYMSSYISMYIWTFILWYIFFFFYLFIYLFFFFFNTRAPRMSERSIVDTSVWFLILYSSWQILTFACQKWVSHFPNLSTTFFLCTGKKIYHGTSTSLKAIGVTWEHPLHVRVPSMSQKELFNYLVRIAIIISYLKPFNCVQTSD